jgi:Cysteine-rich CWC
MESGGCLIESKVCPICNRDNKCAISNGEQFNSCWCMTITIPAELLEKSPDKSRCICQKCVNEYIRRINDRI